MLPNLVLAVLLLWMCSVGGDDAGVASVAKRRILLNPPLSSFLNSHLLNMERLAEFYAEHGYEVYLVGVDFLQTRRVSLNSSIHLLTCPLLGVDDPTERDRLLRPSSDFVEEKLRRFRLGRLILGRSVVECESILSADNGRFLDRLRSYRFDLVLFEFDCGLILADYLGIPKIIIDNMGIAPFYRSFVSIHLGSFPLLAFPFSHEMSLLERTANVAAYCLLNAIITFIGRPPWTRLYNEKMKTNFGDLSESYYNTSMMFVNTRLEFEYPVALMHNVLPIGGAYLKQHDSSTLGADIVDFISGHKVIYVSFGTVHQFTTSEYDFIMKTLSQLTSYRILWQTRHNFSSSSLAEHIRLVSWIHQPTVLGINEIQLFVGHGGLNSALESAYYGTPYLIIPLLGDQFFNCRRVTVHQMGRCLRKEQLVESNLLDLIQEMLKNPVYKRNAMKLSRGMQFHDVKKDILHWTETIIEHKGWPFLPTPFKRLPWYSYFLLDVVLIISAVVLLLLAVFLLCCRSMKRCCCRKAKTKVD